MLVVGDEQETCTRSRAGCVETRPASRGAGARRGRRAARREAAPAGRLTSARAKATRCCSPPESSWGRRRSLPASPTSAVPRERASCHLGGGDPGRPEPEGDVVGDAHPGKQGVGLEDGVDGPPVGRLVGDVDALDETAPIRVDRDRRSRRSRVVLPQPDGPSSPKISPGATANETSSTATVGPNARRTACNSTTGVPSSELIERPLRAPAQRGHETPAADESRGDE